MFIKQIQLPLALWLAFFSTALLATAAPAENTNGRQLPASITNSIFYRRWLWHEQDRVLPDGRVPHRARERALQQIQVANEQAPAVPALPVPGNAWVPIGPARSPSIAALLRRFAEDHTDDPGQDGP